MKQFWLWAGLLGAFPAAGQTSPAARPATTASPRVQLLDSAFAMPQLGRTRRVWLYLPADYATTRRRYPVLYLQDGESVFDAAQARGREGAVEWQVDETLDAARHPCIVVAVAADPAHRAREYHPLPPDSVHRNEGRQYLSFLTETLKPYVDAHYRTRSDRANTALAGSSLGGLLAFYAGLYYPEVFGSVGVFSPSFWLAPEAEAELRRVATPARHNRQRYYFYAGGQEIRTVATSTPIHMAGRTREMADLLRMKTRARVQITIRPDGRHGALAWQQAFPAFYTWLTSRGGFSH